MQIQQHLKMRLGIAPGFQRLTGQAWRLAPLSQTVVRQVIVEHRIFHTPLCNTGRQVCVQLCQGQLKPQLRAQVRHQSLAHIAQCRKYLIGEFEAAQPPFPTDELRKNTRGDAVGGQFTFDSDQPFGHLLHRTAARGHVTLKPIAMDVDDPRQHAVSCHIYDSPSRVVRDHTLCKRQWRITEPVRMQNLRTDKFNFQHLYPRSDRHLRDNPAGSTLRQSTSSRDQTRPSAKK